MDWTHLPGKHVFFLGFCSASMDSFFPFKIVWGLLTHYYIIVSSCFIQDNYLHDLLASLIQCHLYNGSSVLAQQPPWLQRLSARCCR